MPYTGQNIFKVATKESRDRSLGMIEQVRSGRSFQVPETRNAKNKSLEKRFATSQQVRSGQSFQVPEGSNAKSISAQKRMAKSELVRSGQYFSGNASKNYFERNMQSVQARAQRNAALQG
jgi:hypothetical protein